ncbi:hypothetical protein ASPBRDRAFT_481501 [Aspergillus brasiliensis CBS 101740]|uniref:Uncharacterized protein n=1 Tax=Aspergillus brasiliensis (strain CBS 101740 / IMI 381727 / IBT 21946) TaxID=767769 RepID=A0A1L9UU48_ASPBC|nr:hypothetical protein ASPBRDRAFT_481501 [Aspergillus brasiliensis CBS 101740]
MSTLVALTCPPGHSRSSLCSASLSYARRRPETLRSAPVSICTAYPPWGTLRTYHNPARRQLRSHQNSRPGFRGELAPTGIMRPIQLMRTESTVRFRFFFSSRHKGHVTGECSRSSPIHQSVAPKILDTNSNTFIVVRIIESYGS